MHLKRQKGLHLHFNSLLGYLSNHLQAFETISIKQKQSENKRQQDGACMRSL